uniref:Uncharacterized protein n=1 Tax=Peronospora matthiolae TaxID=2874970 RepID=A0AAV1T8Y5_9STRA
MRPTGIIPEQEKQKKELTRELILNSTVRDTGPLPRSTSVHLRHVLQKKKKKSYKLHDF